MAGRKKTIVFTIPSFNEADSIGALTRAIDHGLAKYFPKHNSIILNVDNDSPDGTKEAFLSTSTHSEKVYLSSRNKPQSQRGKGYHMKIALKFALRKKALALAFVDGDVVSATPEWVKLLLDPVLKGKADHVLPVYLRNELDGSITNHLAYPVLFGLLNSDIRQPLAGEIALSPKAIKTFLASKWTNYAYHYGVDILFVTESIFKKLRIAQVFIGVKSHKPSAPKLDGMFMEVAGSLLSQLKNHGKLWLKSPPKAKILRSKSPNKNLIPPALNFDYEAFRKSVEINYTGIFEISSLEWAREVYKFIRQKNASKKELEALRSLFFMRFLSFYNEIRGKSHVESESVIKDQAKLFKDLKNLALNNGEKK